MRFLFLILALALISCTSSHKTVEEKPKEEENPIDFSLKKLSDIDMDKLKLVDSSNEICIMAKQHSSATKYYHYSILDTTKANYNSYVYYYCADLPQAFVLANYDKKGKYIDDIIVSYMYGDGGDFDHSEGTFLNDTIIIRTDTTGHCEWIERPNGDSCKIILDNLIKLKISIKKDGHIHTDTIK
ncbi:MAG: hypothetical protein ABI388_01270 [Bacteroidia bacterium]